jgi:hypothetical protein
VRRERQVRKPRRARRLDLRAIHDKAAVVLTRCPVCDFPIVSLAKQEGPGRVAVDLVNDDGWMIYDMNPYFDPVTHHRHDWECVRAEKQAYALRKHESDPKRGLKDILATIGGEKSAPVEAADGGQGEDGETLETF